jgi:hypothetical protein
MSFVKNVADYNCTVGSLGHTPGHNGQICDFITKAWFILGLQIKEMASRYIR